MAALAQQVPPAPRHPDPAGREPPLHPGQPALQRPQADRLGVPLGGRRVPADPLALAAGGDGGPRPDPADPGPQAGALRAQVPVGELPLVLAGAGDRARPA